MLHPRNSIAAGLLFLATILSGLPNVWAQTQKTVVAMGDFQGVLKHPALARALSQEIAENLATHPSITMVSRQVIQNLMKQSGISTVTSGRAADLASASKAQVLVTGEIVEDNNALSVQLRLFQAEGGKNIGSRKLAASYRDIQNIPVQASKAIIEMLNLPAQEFSAGASNLSSLIQFGEGLSLSDQGKFTDAAQKFAKAGTTDENFHLSHTWQKQMASNGLQSSNDALERVRLLRLQGDNAGALQELNKAQEQGQINGVAERILRAELLLENGDTKGATGEIEALIRSGSQDSQVFFNLGRVMRITGKVDEAIKAFENAKKIDPKNGEVLINLGELYQVQGDFNKSANEFKTAGDMLFDALNYQGALVLYRRARAVLPQDVQMTLAEGKALVELGAFIDAIPVLESALMADAKNNEVMNYLGRAYFLQGDNTKSIKLFKASYQANPNDFTVNYYLGLYYHKDKGNKESQKLALQHLQAAITLQPEHKEALLALARHYRELGMAAQAKQTYEKLRELDGANYIVLKEAGDFLSESGSYQEAEVLYSEAVRLNPDYLEAREDLGQMYQKQGKKDKADEQFAIVRKIDPSSIGRESVVYKQLAELMKTLPNQVRTEFGTKPIETIALIDLHEKLPASFFGRVFHSIRLKKIDRSKFIFTIEQGLLSRYVVRYLNDVKEQVSSTEYSFENFKMQSTMQGLCRSLNVDGVVVVEIEELEKIENLKQTKFRFSVKMFDRITPAYWGNATVANLSNKEFYTLNYLPFLCLFAAIVIGTFIYIRERKIGRGNIKVVIRYDKKDAAGYFSLKVSKKQNDPWAMKVGKGNKKFTKKATFRSKSEEYMVGDETEFKKFRSGKYFVHLFGNIAEKADKSKIIGTFSIAKPVTVKKDEEIKVEFNLIQDEAYVEVIVEFQGRILVGAEVACKETNTKAVTKAEQGAGFNLRPGIYHLVATHEDLKTNYLLKVSDLEAKEAKIEMHEANRFIAQGQFEHAAEIFVKAGDEIEAARMYEKAGKLLKACRILGEKFIREENLEKALACYKRAEDYESMAALYQRMGDMEKSYRSFGMGFMQKKEFDDAIRMFSEIKDYENLAKAFAAKGDIQNQYRATGEFHKSKGEDLEAAGAFERGDDFAQAGAAYARVGNLVKAGEMLVKANDHAQAAELFLKAGDKTRAAMAFEKAGLLERAAELYHGLGDTAKAPRVLLEAGKFIDAAKAYRANGLLDEALAALRKVGVNHPEFVDSCDLMATIFEEKGEMGLALQAAQRGLESVVIDDSNLDRFYSLGKRQETSGEINAAINTFEKILSVNMEYKDLTHHVRTLKENLQAKTVMGKSSLMGGGAQTKTDGTVAGSTRYEIMKEIGRGGMGVVYQAKDKLLERIVAYKLLPDQIKDNPDALAAFLREAKAAAKLTHQNMVTIFDTGQENGNYYITMEFVEGQTLKQLLTRTPKQLRPIDVVTVALMICDGLSYAHKNRIIHRDIKPSNIMINKNRQVKIMDFGLATVMQTAALDKTLMRGTPLYMAPEMILGQGVDYRSDIYSMGITLYEMATKRVPFNTGDVAYHHLHTAPPVPTQFNPAIPPEMEAMIMKAIAKKQDERFQSMDELIVALKRLEQSLQSAQTQAAAQA